MPKLTLTTTVTTNNEKTPYWLDLTRNLALAIALMAVLKMIFPAVLAGQEVYWGAFYGFAYCYSMLIFKSLGQYVLFFAFSLIRILFFGYCMVLTADADPHRTLLVLAGCFGYLCILSVKQFIFSPQLNNE